MIVLAATNTEELEKEWECLTELTKLGGSTSLMESKLLMTSLTDVFFSCPFLAMTLLFLWFSCMNMGLTKSIVTCRKFS